MAETFFIGDTHFGHSNILKFYPDVRPFGSLEEMHEEMIKRWNSVVTNNDTVWHLGDVVFGKQWLNPIMCRLQGNKKLIMGNHDQYDIDAYARWFGKIRGCAYFDGKILTHIPVHESQVKNRWTANIHGHLHGNNYDDHRYWNVSCEQINLTPISYEELKAKHAG